MREIAVALDIDEIFRIDTQFDNDRNLVETLGAPQLDDEVRREALVFEDDLLIWLGNTLTPRTIIMSSERPATFSIRRIERAVPGSKRDRSRVR